MNYQTERRARRWRESSPENSAKSIVRVPRELSDLTTRLFSTKLSDADRIENFYDYKGRNGKRPTVYRRWEKGGVEYRIISRASQAFDISPPKMGVSQDKNVKALLFLTTKKYAGNTEPKQGFPTDFSLKEYAELRGYSETEIRRGGAIFEELKRDIVSGALTSYSVDVIKIGTDRFRSHGLPALYTPLEFLNKRSKWRIGWNYPYVEWIGDLIESWDRTVSYFKHIVRELGDRETTKRPHTHYLYNQLIRARVKSGPTWPIKIKNLLAAMGFPEDDIRSQPKKCFSRLTESLHHIGTNYPEELHGITIFSEFPKGFPKKDTIEEGNEFMDLEVLRVMDRREFEEVTFPGCDFRELYLSFRQQDPLDIGGDSLNYGIGSLDDDLDYGGRHSDDKPKREWKRKHRRDLTDEETSIVREIFQWTKEWEKDNCEINFSHAQRRNFLQDCVVRLGYECVKDLYRGYTRGRYVDPDHRESALDFLTKILPDKMKEKKGPDR